MKKIFAIIALIVMITIPSVNAASYGWGFSRNDNHETPEIGSYNNEIKDTNSYYVGDTEQKTIYLTFDAGYDNGYLIKILDVLDEKGVKAAFFVTGDFLNRQSELTKEIHNRGHLVCNHSWSHKNITTLSKSQLDTELSKVEDKFEELTGSKMSKYFRPPAGEFNKTSLSVLKENGYSTIFWSLAYKDWDVNKQNGADYAYNSVMNNIHNGAIILMHTVSSDNANALGKIIDSLHNEGYEFASLDLLVQNQSS